MPDIIYKELGMNLILGEAEWCPTHAFSGYREGPQTHEQWNQYRMVKKRKMNGDLSIWTDGTWKKPPWRVRPILGQMYRGKKYPVPHPWSSMQIPVCPICDDPHPVAEEPYRAGSGCQPNCGKQTSLTDFRMLGDENESHPPRQ